jgi:NTP pyrophosphatase (non-canonical NTP hydrolase)
MADDFEALTVDQYVREAARTDQRKGPGTIGFTMLGLVGETGSLLAEAKKKQRDAASYLGYAEAVAEEIGDVLWYLAAVARRHRLTLSDIAAAALVADGTYSAGDNAALSLHALQPAHMPLAKAPMPKFEHGLLGLAGEVGLLAREIEGAGHTAHRVAVAQRLVAIMRRLIQAATDSGVTLEGAAIKNLQKIFDRWPRERRYPPAFDEDKDAEEQLPRTMEIRGFPFPPEEPSGANRCRFRRSPLAY